MYSNALKYSHLQKVTSIQKFDTKHFNIIKGHFNGEKGALKQNIFQFVRESDMNTHYSKYTQP